MLNNIMTDEQQQLLQQLIETSNNIIITCHVNADGDAIGSSLAWAEFLRLQGKDDVRIIVPDQYPDFLQWLPNTEKVLRYDKHKEEADLLFKIADLIFCLDFNVPSRVDEEQESLLSSPAKRVLIDHHLGPDVPAVLTISHPEASSTSELIFRIVWQMGAFEQLGKHFAVPLYCGMMTDTGGFTFNSSNPDIYFIISQLLTKHIDKDRIYRKVYNNYSENRLRLTGFVLLKKLVVDSERHASYYALTREDLRRFHFVKGDAEGLVNMPLQIKGHKLSISLREDTEKPKLVWVSLRSVDQFPCNTMAEMFFNGGGHLNAAGGHLDCTIEEAIATAQRAILHFEEQLKK